MFLVYLDLTNMHHLLIKIMRFILNKVLLLNLR